MQKQSLTSLAFAAAMAFSPLASAQCVDNQPSITVEGQGIVEQTATHTDISATFTAQRKTSAKAVAALEERFNPVLADIRSDLPDDRIQTDQLNIRPLSARNDDGYRYIKSFRVSHTLTLSEIPLPEAGEWVQRLSTKVSRLSLVNESAPDNPPIENEALTRAVGNARDRAATLANALGQDVGRALCVDTTARTTPTPRAARAQTESMVADTASAMKVTGSSLRSSATVTVTFALETDQE